MKSIKEAGRNAAYHVKVKLSGKNREQFINICLRRKIDIWGLSINENFTEFCISAASFKKNVRQIVKKTGVHVKVISRGGFFHKLKNYRFRIPLAIYLVIAALTVLCCSSFVWHVDVTGGSYEEREHVKNFLISEGIKAGALLKDIDTKKLSNKIVMEVESVKWAGVSKKGTVLNVELLNEETYDNGENIITGPRHIVAKKDALIKKIVAESGTAVMTENSVVLKGETVISGYVYPIDEIYGTEPREVSATGEVVGIVRYSANMPVETEIKTYTLTGRTESASKIKILNFELPLSNLFKNKKKQGACGFESYNTVVKENAFSLDYFHILPVSIITSEYYETTEKSVILSDTEAFEYAQMNAMRLLDDKIPDDANIIKTGSEMRLIDGITCCCVWAECEENIGEYVRINDSSR